MKETMERLSGIQKKLKTVSLVYFAVLILGVGLTIFRQRIPGAAITGAALIFYFCWLRKQFRGYNDEVAKASILNGLIPDLKNARYLGREGLTGKELKEMAVFPVHLNNHPLLLRQGFEGEKDGMTIRGWESTSHYARSPRRTDYAFLSGTLMTASYDQALPEHSDWVAIKRDLVASGVLEAFFREEGYQEIQTEDSKFDQNFAVGIKNGGVYPARMIPRIAGITARLENISVIRCSSDWAAVYLDRCFYTVDVKAGDLPTEEQLKKNLLPERDDLWELFAFMRKKPSGATMPDEGQTDPVENAQSNEESSPDAFT